MLCLHLGITRWERGLSGNGPLVSLYTYKSSSFQDTLMPKGRASCKVLHYVLPDERCEDQTDKQLLVQYKHYPTDRGD
jgi:hypothetical protein